MVSEDVRDGIIDLIKILDKGIAMKHHVQDFYRHASEKIRSVHGRKMFDWLVEFKANHEQKLREKRKELLEHPALEGFKPPPIDMDKLLSEVSLNTILPANPTDVDILHLAMENEERAFAFFTRKSTHSHYEHIKTMFETMAAEEEKHIKILTDIRRRLQIEGVWGDYKDME